MGYDFLNNTPIYIQIIEQLKISIISGKYKQGDKIPSVRELSLEFEVNPNTIQKALFELEDLGLIYTERTNGKFVTSDSLIIEKIKQQTICEKLEKFYDDMGKIGLSKKQVMEIIKEGK